MSRFTARSAWAAAFALAFTLWCSPARSQPHRLSFTGPPEDPAFDVEAAAVAYNPVQNTFAVVWSADDDGGGQVDDELEIFIRFANPTLGPIGGLLRISSFGGLGDPDFDAVEPDVAYNSDAHEFLVVWATSAAGVPGPLVARRLDASNGAPIGSEIELSAGMRAETPAVAYNPVTEEYLVVWSSDDSPETAAGEMEIFVRRLAGSTATPLGGGGERISRVGPDLDPEFGAVHPDVVADSTTGRYGVVWFARDADPIGQVNFQALTGLGVEIGADDRPLGVNVVLADLPVTIAHNPLAGTGGEYLLVWTQAQNEPLVAVYGSRINGLTLLPYANGLIQLSGADAGRRAAVAARSDGDGWVVAWNGNDADLVIGESEIFATVVNAAGAPGPKVRVSENGPPGDNQWRVRHPAIAAGSVSSGTAGFVWTGEDDQDMVDGEYEVFGRALTLPIFADGFESGSTGAWTAAVGD